MISRIGSTCFRLRGIDETDNVFTVVNGTTRYFKAQK